MENCDIEEPQVLCPLCGELEGTGDECTACARERGDECRKCNEVECRCDDCRECGRADCICDDMRDEYDEANG